MSLSAEQGLRALSGEPIAEPNAQADKPVRTLTDDEFTFVQYCLLIAARMMTERQLLALADGLFEIHVSRRGDRARHATPDAPRRRWTDKSLPMRGEAAELAFWEVFGDAMRAALKKDAPAR